MATRRCCVAAHGPLSCRELVAIIAEYVDDGLTPAQARRLERHLAACGGCAEYVAQVRAAAHLSARIPVEPLDAVTRAALAGLYRDVRGEW